MKWFAEILGVLHGAEAALAGFEFSLAFRGLGLGFRV